MEELTTTEAAERLGKGIRWVQALIKSGRLPARKMGRDYIINAKDLKLVAGLKPGPVPSGAKKPRRKKASKKSAAE